MSERRVLFFKPTLRLEWRGQDASAQGVVVGVGSGSAQRGYKVVVPVDGMSAEDAYNEQYAAWHL
jgi:hypothetical protein